MTRLELWIETALLILPGALTLLAVALAVWLMLAA